jgi:hypothetical protein
MFAGRSMRVGLLTSTETDDRRVHDDGRPLRRVRDGNAVWGQHCNFSLAAVFCG